MQGPVLLHGVPGCGKSTKARELAAAASEATGWPILVHDPAQAATWSDLPRVGTVSAALEEAVGRGRHVALGLDDAEMVGKLCGGLLAVGGVVLVLDELRTVSTAYSAPRGLVLLARQWRHAGRIGASIILGTQRINDCAGDVIAACSRILTGRCTSPRVLDYLRTEFGLEAEKVQALGRGEFLETKLGMD